MSWFFKKKKREFPNPYEEMLRSGQNEDAAKAMFVGFVMRAAGDCSSSINSFKKLDTIPPANGNELAEKLDRMIAGNMSGIDAMTQHMSLLALLHWTQLCEALGKEPRDCSMLDTVVVNVLHGEPLEKRVEAMIKEHDTMAMFDESFLRFFVCLYDNYVRDVHTKDWSWLNDVDHHPAQANEFAQKVLVPIYKQYGVDLTKVQMYVWK